MSFEMSGRRICTSFLVASLDFREESCGREGKRYQKDVYFGMKENLDEQSPDEARSASRISPWDSHSLRSSFNQSHSVCQPKTDEDEEAE